MCINNIKQLLLLALISFMISCQGSSFKEDLHNILGVTDVEIIENKTTNEFGGFSEGHTIEVYGLSQSTMHNFLELSAKKLPEKLKKEQTWQKHDWSKTPVDSSYNEIFALCLNYSSGNIKLEEQLNEIKKVLNKSDVYYSFYFKPDKTNPEDVVLFILEPRNGKLYIVESNI